MFWLTTNLWPMCLTRSDPTLTYVPNLTHCHQWGPLWMGNSSKDEQITNSYYLEIQMVGDRNGWSPSIEWLGTHNHYWWSLYSLFDGHDHSDPEDYNFRCSWEVPLPSSSNDEQINKWLLLHADGKTTHHVLESPWSCALSYCICVGWGVHGSGQLGWAKPCPARVH